MQEHDASLSSKQEYIEEELLILAHAGEIPEVAYHSSLYYLTEDPEGPRLALDHSDLLPLKQAVHDRYRKILLRDCNPKLRDKPVYRGLARCIANWRRFRKYCRKEGFTPEPVRAEVVRALKAFLWQEMEEVTRGERRSSVNCRADELAEFLEELGIAQTDLPPDWQRLCREDAAEDNRFATAGDRLLAPC